MKTKTSQLAVFGSVDGLTMFMGVVFGLIVSRHGSSAAWHAAIGGGVGELVGMTAGSLTSDRTAGWRPALACGGAGGLACVLPGVPFAVASGWAAGLAASAVACSVAGGIAWLRPERGLRSIATTYGILAVAALLSGLSGLI